MIEKVKTLAWAYVISDLKGEEIVEMFYKKELQETNQKELRVEKVMRRKATTFMLVGKATIILSMVGLIKKKV